MSDTPEEWSPAQRELFRRLYRHMVEAQHMFVHPGAAQVSPDHLNTVAWNAAWIAAVMIDPDAPLVAHLAPGGEGFICETPPGAMLQ